MFLILEHKTKYRTQVSKCGNGKCNKNNSYFGIKMCFYKCTKNQHPHPHPLTQPSIIAKLLMKIYICSDYPSYMVCVWGGGEGSENDMQQGFFYMHYHRQDNTYHGLCYTSRGSLAGTIARSAIDKVITACLFWIDPSWSGPIKLFLVPASAPRLV